MKRLKSCLRVFCAGVERRSHGNPHTASGDICLGPVDRWYRLGPEYRDQVVSISAEIHENTRDITIMHNVRGHVTGVVQGPSWLQLRSTVLTSRSVIAVTTPLQRASPPCSASALASEFAAASASGPASASTCTNSASSSIMLVASNSKCTALTSKHRRSGHAQQALCPTCDDHCQSTTALPYSITHAQPSSPLNCPSRRQAIQLAAVHGICNLARPSPPQLALDPSRIHHTAPLRAPPVRCCFFQGLAGALPGVRLSATRLQQSPSKAGLPQPARANSWEPFAALHPESTRPGFPRAMVPHATLEGT
jgi:hypothetical protein